MDYDDSNIDWHAGFFSALRLDLSEDLDKLEIIKQVEVTQMPIILDVLIIRRFKNIPLVSDFDKIFKIYNIVEYKSQDDRLDINNLWQLLAYTAYYVFQNKIAAADVTMILARARKPVKLIRELEQLGYSFQAVEKGIYKIEGKLPFTTYFINLAELDEDNHLFLKSFKKGLQQDMYNKVMFNQTIHSRDNMDWAGFINVLFKANQKEFYLWLEGDDAVNFVLKNQHDVRLALLTPYMREVEDWAKKTGFDLTATDSEEKLMKIGELMASKILSKFENALYSYLIDEGRNEDLHRAIKDPKARQEYLREFLANLPKE